MKTERIFDDIREKITGGELNPGDWLVERDLSNLYNVSRTPIRETLRNLANIGIVEFQPAKGYQVKKLTIEEIVDIFHAREAIEGECARLACSCDSQEFRNKVDNLKAQLEAVDISEDSAQGVAIGKKAHDLIVSTANNQFLIEFYEKLMNLAALTRNMSKNSITIEERSKTDHLNILNALSRLDADESERLVKEHLRSTCKALVRNHLKLP